MRIDGKEDHLLTEIYTATMKLSAKGTHCPLHQGSARARLPSQIDTTSLLRASTKPNILTGPSLSMRE